MNQKKKKLIIFVLSLVVITSLVPNQIQTTDSYDPFFSLVARYTNVRQSEYLNLIKQQLARIGIHLTLDYFNTSLMYTLCQSQFFDLLTLEISCNYNDPFSSSFFDENASLNLTGYHTSMDWDENLGEGRNQWYIDTGLEMTPNDSQERINHCWEWQHYMMGEILPILPLFTQKENHSNFEFLFLNMREVRSYIGSRDAAPGFPSKTKGLLLRKAISYAINLEEIRRIVLGDEYEIIYHPTNPALEDWLSPNSIRYCYNIDYARELMRAAGYDVGFCQSNEPFEYLDWEDVCNGNPSNISVVGFDYIIAITIVTIMSSCWIIHHLRKRKEFKV